MINDFDPENPDDALYDEYREELRRWDDPLPSSEWPQDS
jgi:hypothetical protein